MLNLFISEYLFQNTFHLGDSFSFQLCLRQAFHLFSFSFFFVSFSVNRDSLVSLERLDTTVVCVSACALSVSHSRLAVLRKQGRGYDETSSSGSMLLEVLGVFTRG